MEVNKIKKQAKNAAILKISLFIVAVVMATVLIVLATTSGVETMVPVYVISTTAIFAIGLASFVLHIIVTVEYGKHKDGSSDTVFILLIVGFFVQIIGIVALFMVANSKKIK